MLSSYLIQIYIAVYVIYLAFPQIASPPLGFLASFFLTTNYLVLALNVVFLIMLRDLETEIGRYNFMVIYVLSALAGNLGFFIGARELQIGNGATAGVAGLFGAFAIRHPYVLSAASYYPMPAVMALSAIVLMLLFSGGYFELMPLLIGATYGMMIEGRKEPGTVFGRTR